MSVFIIAEAGVNHNGDHKMARALVDAAADAGADAVKFQTFRAAHLVTEAAPKADYQKTATGPLESQFDMLKRLELSDDAHRDLLARCSERGLQFMSTPFDSASLEFLVDDLCLDTLKLSSGDVTDGPFLLAIARSGKKLIMSTGMSTLQEVEQALAVLALGYTQPAAVTPDDVALRRAFDSSDGRAALREKVTLLHCTTEYPAPLEDVNLRAMDTLREAFGLRTGLSDHTPGTVAAVAAVARGAVVIEKHFTLDRALPGPDHAASLEPDELKSLVDQIRAVEAVLGDGVKVPRPSETGNRKIARKSLVATRPIKQGETFSEDNMTAKRPATGLSPMRFWAVLGTTATRDFATDEAIEI